MELGPEIFFWLKMEENQKIRGFPPLQRGGSFFDIFAHLPHPSPSQKSGFQVLAGVYGRANHNLIGRALIRQNDGFTRG